MTSTSAGSGASTGDGGDGGGESWSGWFTRAKPQPQTSPEAAAGAEPAAGADTPPASAAPGPGPEAEPVRIPGEALGQPAGPDARGVPEAADRPAQPEPEPEPQVQRAGAAAEFASVAESGRAAPPRPRGDAEPGGRGPAVIRPVGSAADRARPAEAAADVPAASAASPSAAAPDGSGAYTGDGSERAHEHPAAEYAESPEYADSPAYGDSAAYTVPAQRGDGLGQSDSFERAETGAELSREALLTRRTLAEIEPQADAVTAYFYALLFLEHPELRELFPASMDAQRDRLFRALLTAVRLSDDDELLHRYLSGLGRGHRKYGTRPEHYPAVGECLITAISQYAPGSWDEETEAAWVAAYTRISQIMIDAAAEDAQRAPAWWNAEIVTHERRTSDIAVISVRPDSPYPFRAGQYTAIETPWWPRVWRHYSFASAPRPDGLLTFHVKAVSAGWVSSALVHRAQPGDVLRLGPPEGSMTLDHRTESGLVCVGGGTGIAPVKALVEDVAQQGSRRPVEVFYGARSGPELYDLETMFKLDQQYAWLSLRPVVSQGPGPAHADAVVGGLPDALRRYGPWRQGCEGFISGPPGMIRSTLDALVASGIPAQRVRYDAVQELVARGD